MSEKYSIFLAIANVLASLLYCVVTSVVSDCINRRLLGDWFVGRVKLADICAIIFGAYVADRYPVHTKDTAFLWIVASFAPVLFTVFPHSRIASVLLEPNALEINELSKLAWVATCNSVTFCSSGLALIAASAAGFATLCYSMESIVWNKNQSISRSSPNVYVKASGALAFLLLYLLSFITRPNHLPPYPTITLTCMIAIFASAWTIVCVHFQRNRHKKAVRTILVVWIAIVTMRLQIQLNASTEQKTAPFLLPGSSWPNFQVIDACELKKGGMISIIEGQYENNSPGTDSLRYRLLRLDHSIIGGIWISPRDVAGHSVYTTFNLQAMAAHFKLLGTLRRSLHVGLGIGSSMASLQAMNFSTDIIELHEEVIRAAEQHFSLDTSKGAVIAADILDVIDSLPSKVYDVAILDIFDGGHSIAGPRLLSFYHELKRILKGSQEANFNQDSHGVLAVNLVALRIAEVHDLACDLKQVFESVRCFSDDSIENADDCAGDAMCIPKKEVISNFVCFAADGFYLGELDVIKLKNVQHFSSLFGALELERAEILLELESSCGFGAHKNTSKQFAAKSNNLDFDKAFAHWKTMRTQFKKGFWEAYK